MGTNQEHFWQHGTACFWNVPGAASIKAPHDKDLSPLRGKGRAFAEELAALPFETRLARCREIGMVSVPEGREIAAKHNVGWGLYPFGKIVILDFDGVFIPDDKALYAHADPAKRAAAEESLQKNPKLWVRPKVTFTVNGNPVPGNIRREVFDLIRHFEAPTEFSYSMMGLHVFLYCPAYQHDGIKDRYYNGLKVEVFTA